MEIYKGVKEHSEYEEVSVGIRFPDQPVGGQAWHETTPGDQSKCPIALYGHLYWNHNIGLEDTYGYNKAFT